MNNESPAAITFRLPKVVHAELKRAARKRGMSQSRLVTQILEEALLGVDGRAGERLLLASALWVRDYLRVASKRPEDELDRLWHKAEETAETLVPAGKT